MIEKYTLINIDDYDFCNKTPIIEGYKLKIGDILFCSIKQYFELVDKKHIKVGYKYKLNQIGCFEYFEHDDNGEFMIICIDEENNKEKKWWRFWMPKFIIKGVYVEKIK